MSSTFQTLARDTNQVRGLAEYAHAMIAGKALGASPAVLARTELFHLDSIASAVSAIALGAQAPRVLRREALEYGVPAGMRGAACLGSRVVVRPEKAVLANSAAAREWDANGTNFGFNPALGHTAGEFGHNDFYPVALAAAQVMGHNGETLLRGMVALDEIRGRLAEVFSLKTYKIDHVVHGAIASAVVYGAMRGATTDQIESAVGQVVAHHIPFRAIRAGRQLSDSKGASAAISAEAAVSCVERAMRGFVGPADIFRNPEAIFCLYQPPAHAGESPFDLVLATTGDDFAVMGMHFKLGIYEHQSAGAIQGLFDLLAQHPRLLENERELRHVRITIYEPAFSIIGDPAKREPRTRQSADHSMVYIIATLLRKALEGKTGGWEDLMLMPADYDAAALRHPLTRSLMDRIEFRHGGREYDEKYPDGIPTSLEIEHETLGHLSSGLVMYPEGHARSTSGNLSRLLECKFGRLAALGVSDVEGLRARFSDLGKKSADDVARLCDFELLGPTPR